MAEYSALKVAELKKLLTERKLSIAGNKPDLIARLEEDDQEKTSGNASGAPASKPVAEDEIDYDDDDIVPAASTVDVAAPTTEAAANGSSADAPVPPSTDKPSTTAQDAARDASDDAAKASAEAEAAAPAEPLFSQHLEATNADEEKAKRAARAKRFGIAEGEDSEDAILAKRAARFGIDKSTIATGLDSALPDRPRKRGRGGDLAEGEGGERGGKRRSDVAGGAEDRQGRNRRRGGRDQRGGNRGGGGGGGGGARAQPVKSGGLFDDPAEKAKAEARAKRFASAA